MGARQVPLCGGGEQFGDRIGAGSGQQQQVAAQGRPRRLPGQPVEQTLGAPVEVGNHLWSGEVFGGEVEGVEVAGGRRRRAGRPGPAARAAAWWRIAVWRRGPGSARAARWRSEGGDCRAGSRVRVSVADHRKVDVVGGAAAGQHGVELLPGLLTGHDAMHGVGGDTLRGVHGGGVTELRSGADVVGGQGDGAAAP